MPTYMSKTPFIFHSIQDSQIFALSQAAGRAGFPILATSRPLAPWGKNSRYFQSCIDMPCLFEVGEGMYTANLKSNDLKGVWLTCMDDVADFTAKHQDALRRNGLQFISPNRDTLHIVSDGHGLHSSSTLQFAPTYLATKDELLNTIQELDYPIMLKSARNYFCVFDHANDLQQTLLSNAIPCYVEDKYRIQKYIDGEVESMATAMLLFDNEGRPIRGFTGRRTDVTPTYFGPFGETTQAKAEWIPELYEGAKDLLQSIGWKGFAEVECKQGPDGQWYVMEINPRLSGWACLAETDGAGFLQAYHEMCTNNTRLEEACLQRSQSKYIRLSGTCEHMPAWLPAEGTFGKIRALLTIFSHYRKHRPNISLGCWDDLDLRASWSVFWFTLKDVFWYSR